MTESSIHATVNGVPALIREFSADRESVIRTLTYFDIFHYPLDEEEIRQFLGTRVETHLLKEWLSQLAAAKRIFLYNGFYSLQNNPLLVHRRKQGNLQAQQLLTPALPIGRFLFQFPFVRAIGISGSLSKNYADEKSDIDFFIITKANRLWIARTIMHAYKKLTFLLGKQHFHCMNYYIDEQAFLLEEQNIFTAIELKTLLPVCGEQVMRNFFETNQWANERLPACPFRSQGGKEPTTSWLKRLAEWLLKGNTGTRLERYLLTITQKRWKRKEQRGQRNKKGIPMGLITGKHFARSNPGAFQEKVLALYEQKISVPESSPSHLIAFSAK